MGRDQGLIGQQVGSSDLGMQAIAGDSDVSMMQFISSPSSGGTVTWARTGGKNVTHGRNAVHQVQVGNCHLTIVSASGAET